MTSTTALVVWHLVVLPNVGLTAALVVLLHVELHVVMPPLLRWRQLFGGRKNRTRPRRLNEPSNQGTLEALDHFYEQSI
jgi:hypothetical protein